MGIGVENPSLKSNPWLAMYWLTLATLAKKKQYAYGNKNPNILAYIRKP